MRTLFCTHRWVVLSDLTGKTPFEELQEGGQSLGSLKGNSSWLFKRVHMQTLTCHKCGRLKHFVDKL